MKKRLKKMMVFLSLLLSMSLFTGSVCAYAQVINGFDTAKVFNVSLVLNDGTASATSDQGSGSIAANAIDGSGSTGWHSTNTVAPSVASPQAIAVKFNTVKTIYKVRWKADEYYTQSSSYPYPKTYHPQTPKTYEIQYAVNADAKVTDSPYSSNWAAVNNMTNGDQGEELTNGLVSANKVTDNLYNATSTVVSHTFDPVQAHGLRMIITDKNGGYAWVALGELLVYGNSSQDKFNVGLSYNGGTADATGYYDSNYVPSRINNGAGGDGWLSPNVAPTEMAPHVVGLNFSSKMIINKLRWNAWSSATPQTPKKYEIQYAVSESASIKDAPISPNWAPVSGMTNGDAGQEMTNGTVSGNTVTNNTLFQPTTVVSHTFTPAAAYGVRMIITDRNGTTVPYVALGEMEVYGNYEGVSTPPENPIPAPANLKASNVTDTSLTLAWDAVTHSGLSGYKVYQNGIHIASVASNVTGANVLNLTSGTAYTFEVTAITTGGTESAKSAPVQVTTLNTPVDPPPAAVTGLVQTNVTSNSATIAWNPVSDADLAGYKVYKNGALYQTVGKMTGLTIPQLQPQTTYTFEVAALDMAGQEGAKSNTLSVTTTVQADTIPPTAVANLVYSNVTSTGAALAWDANMETDLAGYKVYIDGVLYKEVGKVNSLVLNTLFPGTTYNVYVTAVDTSGNESQPGQAVSFTTLNSATPPPGGGQGGTGANSGTSLSYLNIYNSTVSINIISNSYNNMYPVNPNMLPFNMFPPQ